MANTNLAGSGLEGHLRNLILNNAGTDAGAPQGHQEASQNAFNRADSSMRQLDEGNNAASVTGDATIQDGQDFQDPRQPQVKGARKRPNQAQRRQMNAQFSIPVDTRQQTPSYSHKPSSGPHGYQPRSHPSYHRHAEAGSHHQPHSQHHGADSRFSNRSWNDARQGHPAHGSNHPQSFPNPLRGPSSAAHDRTTHGGPRHNQSFGGNHPYRQHHRPEIIARQGAFLDDVAYKVVANSEIDRSEIAEKEAFRQSIETISRIAITQHEVDQNGAHGFPPLSVELKCFGSLSSGFATKASDMDLGLLSPLSKISPDAAGSPIPRLLEKALLDAGLGARLLTRTRVPIIKLCQYPPDELRRGLLEERDKWENGISHDFVDEDDHEEAAGQNHEEEPVEPASVDASPNTINEFELPVGPSREPRRFHLRQGTKTLQAYHALAKRVLRKAGGRDVSMSNYREFTDHDWEILNGVCQAFVKGLADAKLQQRLSQYPSLRFDSYPPANHRSLMGVFTQIEGEHTLQTWETWSAKDDIQSMSPLAEQTVRIWEETQNKTSFASDPILYNKELQYALDKLKKLPFIQLITLEQGQYETPSQYHTRLVAILRSLQSQTHDLSPRASQASIDRYVYGIYQKEIRDAVKANLASSEIAWDIDAVGYRHKSLHLAREFERALEKELYDEACIDDIQQYIGMLRSPLQLIQGEGRTPRFFIPVSKEKMGLISRIGTLQDPHSLAPNQARDKYHDRLEFPKSGAGIQCDINFSAHLALQNTLLLRCYSHTDPRVRPMVLFIKHWAKVRGINSGYRGTLSSYGYVLMVLHYLVNVVQPFVCPNLQKLAQPPPPDIAPTELEQTVLCKGYNVQFWRNETQILQLARDHQLNHNNESIGILLRGFFEYYAQPGIISNGSCKGFDWGRDVLSLRTHGGLVTKQEKGWTGAKTTLEVQSTGNAPEDASKKLNANATASIEVGTGDSQTKHPSSSKQGAVKEVRHRYLFAIEDPFELDHNVARTVTHNGIVSIRDEFRRAWAILQAVGREQSHDDLLKDVIGVETGPNAFSKLLTELHGNIKMDDIDG
ncbi:Poly(A) RNA polymerase protein cid1 [Paramyrothecium foliicola]|nr:Poly(A) RNA polymerase protein cid1 [Paramyrothecium foliicola]